MQKEISLKKKVQNSALFRKLALICPCPLTSSFQFLTSNFQYIPLPVLRLIDVAQYAQVALESGRSNALSYRGQHGAAGFAAVDAV